MAVPVVIFVVCIAAGAGACARWQPELSGERTGTIAFFAVSGLMAAALAVFGLGIYSIVENLGDSGILGGRRILADGLESVLWQTGVLIALALGVYLLAPPPRAPALTEQPPGSGADAL